MKFLIFCMCLAGAYAVTIPIIENPTAHGLISWAIGLPAYFLVVGWRGQMTQERLPDKRRQPIPVDILMGVEKRSDPESR